ncbi:MAG: hypothetical protein ACOX81_10570 [Candidatus Heteroscillospira sp.]
MKNAQDDTTVTAVIRNMTDQEAVQAMRDSNKQRDQTLPSELAALLDLEVEAIKHQGGRLDGVAPGDVGKRSVEIVGEAHDMNYKKVMRYLRLIREALAKGPADFPAFLALMEEDGYAVKHGRGGAISFLAPGQDKATRLRASTLGQGFDPEDIQAVIDGKRPLPELSSEEPRPPRKISLVIDIQARMREGKGAAYQRWATVYNIKQMAAALQYVRENKLTDYDRLEVKTDAAVDRFHALTDQLRQTEAALYKTSELMGATVEYAKTRPVFDGYKAAKYSKKYLAEHEAELAAYRAATAVMRDILAGSKLPKMDKLKADRRELAEKKKALYAEYRRAQEEMREMVAVKGNIDRLRGLTDEQKNKEQER